MDNNEVYYKIYKSERLNGKLTVVCMQWFDEDDYESERFLKNKHGEELIFHNECQAIEWLFNNIKEELIDPEYAKSVIRDDSIYYKNNQEH